MTDKCLHKMLILCVWCETCSASYLHECASEPAALQQSTPIFLEMAPAASFCSLPQNVTNYLAACQGRCTRPWPQIRSEVPVVKAEMVRRKERESFCQHCQATKPQRTHHKTHIEIINLYKRQRWCEVIYSANQHIREPKRTIA